METRDGGSLSGFLVEQDNRIIVLRVDKRNVTRPREDLVELKPAGLSLMPEGLLESFDPHPPRDLFAGLRCTQPLVGGPGNT